MFAKKITKESLPYYTYLITEKREQEKKSYQ